LELAPHKATLGHRYKLFKKPEGTLGQKFFSVRAMDLWNGLDDRAVAVSQYNSFSEEGRNIGILILQVNL